MATGNTPNPPDADVRSNADELLRHDPEGVPHLIDEAGDAVFVHDLEGRFFMVSRRACEVLGYARHELLSMSVMDIEAGLPPAECRAMWQRLVPGQAITVEGAHRRKDGSTFPVEVRISTMEWNNRRLVLALTRDITERKRAEEALARYAERLLVLGEMSEALLAAESPEAIARAALHHLRRLVPSRRASVVEFDWPRARAHILAVDTDTATAIAAGDWIPLSRFGPTDALRRGQYLLIDDLAAATTRSLTQDKFVAEGVRAYLRVPLIYKGELLGTLNIGSGAPGALTAEDVQVAREAAGPLAIAIERRRSDEERREWEAKVRHAQKLEGLGVLAGGIAHDFNNLLAGILGNASLLQMELPAGESPARASARQIEKIAMRAAELTSQMLAYSGKGRFTVEPVNLSAVAREMMALLAVSIGKRINLVCSLADDLPLIEADATQMRQVIMNLITNASEAVGDAYGTITLTSGVMDADAACLADVQGATQLAPGRYVFIEVRDTGCGMNEETQARIFDLFFTTKFSGRGLGLPVVLGIVRGHRGGIRVESTPGGGATFRVLFPVSSRPLFEAQAQPAAPADPPDARTASGGTVLVIDDDPTVRQVDRMALEHFGFTVLVAADGREGIEILRGAGLVDVVLLDVTMPDMRGGDVLDVIRRLRPDMRVLLTSGYEESDVAARLGGRTAFIQKPYPATTLVEKIREILAS